ncbi:ABC transporter ATP-binding protein [Limnochorda pilosa]|uniref:ABC transporter n=1 Tax=Limnochorda pilosa TaxID=1555112 RepID=A0A0K2SK60_LIMPI|nr:ABC transporter ATP-binding protein [Limnochorda pilosa]BAS27485.1 ABC transporter [Limnochorda pilosa]
MSALLSVEGLAKRFGGLQAVSDFHLNVPEGTVSSLIGPNGAGKTTVFNLITGIHRPDAGSIRFLGRELARLLPHQVAELGIARTFQTVRLFPNLTCFENVLAGQHCRSRAGVWASLVRTPAQRREEARVQATARRCLEQVGLWRQRDELATSLAYGDRKRLEIARALATEPVLLILDEPAGGLNDRESEALMELILQVRASGVTVLLIEHDMHVVMGISDQVTVMENGRVIATGSPEAVRNAPEVVEAYLGHDDVEEDL